MPCSEEKRDGFDRIDWRLPRLIMLEGDMRLRDVASSNDIDEFEVG